MSHFLYHVLEPVVMSEFKKVVLTPIMEKLILNYCIIKMTANNLKPFKLLLLSLSQIKSIMRQKDIFVLDYHSLYIPRSEVASFVFWVQYSLHCGCAVNKK